MYDKKRVETLRGKIKDYYYSYYGSKGFVCNDPLPLHINFDPSLSFVNCTICHFKKAYFNNQQLNSYCVIQPALRTNTYRTIHSKEDLKYTASLEMLGAFSNTDSNTVFQEFKHHMLLQSDFLQRILGIDGYVTVKVSPSLIQYLTDDVIEKMNNNKTIVLKNNVDLLWNYGIDGIFGIGTDWIVHRQGVEYEFGNVIVLYKKESPIGVESGGSVELLLQILCGFPHKIYANVYCNNWVVQRIEQGGSMMIEYFDSLDVISHILAIMDNSLNLPPKLEIVLEEYIRALKCILYIKNISLDVLVNDMYFLKCCENLSVELFLEHVFIELKKHWDISVIISNHNKKNCREKANAWRGFSELEKKTLRTLLQQKTIVENNDETN